MDLLGTGQEAGVNVQCGRSLAKRNYDYVFDGVVEVHTCMFFVRFYDCSKPAIRVLSYTARGNRALIRLKCGVCVFEGFEGMTHVKEGGSVGLQLGGGEKKFDEGV